MPARPDLILTGIFRAACYHFSVPITDTSAAAQAIQLNIHRSMTGEQRLLLAYEMSMFARELNGRGCFTNIRSGPKQPLPANYSDSPSYPRHCPPVCDELP